MKYLVIGAGGTGGGIGSYLAKAGQDVTFIARGAHLAAMKERGLRVLRPEDEFTIFPVKAETTDSYEKMIAEGTERKPDVIFICVKGYGVDALVPFLAKVAAPDTAIIPIVNIYGTGGELAGKLPELFITDGCIYIASQIEAPGVIRMNGMILRVVFGVREPDAYRPVLKQVEEELNEAGIRGILSGNIRRDAWVKFSYVSAQGACGLYFDVPAGAIQKEGEPREAFISLIRENVAVAEAMGITFEEDLVERNLKILAGLTENATTSMQRDIAEGKASEIDGLIYEVVRKADKYGVDAPWYNKVAEKMKKRGL